LVCEPDIKLEVKEELINEEDDVPSASAPIPRRYEQENDMKPMDESNHKCEICFKSFGQRSSLTTHQEIHYGIKSFKCPTCPKAFQQKAHLDRHMEIHKKIKPFKCEKCGLSFSKKSSLGNRHRCMQPEQKDEPNIELLLNDTLELISEPISEACIKSQDVTSQEKGTESGPLDQKNTMDALDSRILEIEKILRKLRTPYEKELLTRLKGRKRYLKKFCSQMGFQTVVEKYPHLFKIDF